MFGGALTVPVADVDRMDYLVIMGANPYASNGSLMTAPDFPGRLEALRARGGTLRGDRPAPFADRGEEPTSTCSSGPAPTRTSCSALVNVLVTEGLVNLGACDGLVSRPRRGRAARADVHARGRRAGVRHRRRRRSAASPATSPRTERAGVYGRIGTCTQEFGTVASWLVDVVNVLAGNLDREGGMMFTLPATVGAAPTPGRRGKGRGVKFGRRQSRVKRLPEFFGEYPVATLADEIETPGDGPDPGDDHHRRQPGGVDARRRAGSTARSRRSTSWWRSTSTATRPRATPT